MSYFKEAEQIHNSQNLSEFCRLKQTKVNCVKSLAPATLVVESSYPYHCLQHSGLDYTPKKCKMKSGNTQGPNFCCTTISRTFKSATNSRTFESATNFFLHFSIIQAILRILNHTCFLEKKQSHFQKSDQQTHF